MKLTKKQFSMRALICGAVISVLATLVLIIFAPSQIVIYTTMAALGFTIAIFAHISPPKGYEDDRANKPKKTWHTPDKRFRQIKKSKNKTNGRGKVIKFPGNDKDDHSFGR